MKTPEEQYAERLAKEQDEVKYLVAELRKARRRLAETTLNKDGIIAHFAQLRQEQIEAADKRREDNRLKQREIRNRQREMRNRGFFVGAKWRSKKSGKVYTVSSVYLNELTLETEVILKLETEETETDCQRRYDVSFFFMESGKLERIQ